MIKLDILALEGHKEATFDDSLPEDRRAVAQEVEDLMSKGYRCFLRCEDGKDRSIAGYDMLNNAWITHASARTGTEVIPTTSKSTVTAVPRIVGG